MSTSLLAHESGSIRILIFPMYFPYWLSQLTRIDWGSHLLNLVFSGGPDIGADCAETSGLVAMGGS